MEIFRATECEKMRQAMWFFPSNYVGNRRGGRYFRWRPFNIMKICCNSKVAVPQKYVMKTDPAQMMKFHPKPS